jgi:hypothetical protein
MADTIVKYKVYAHIDSESESIPQPYFMTAEELNWRMTEGDNSGVSFSCPSLDDGDTLYTDKEWFVARIRAGFYQIIKGSLVIVEVNGHKFITRDVWDLMSDAWGSLSFKTQEEGKNHLKAQKEYEAECEAEARSMYKEEYMEIDNDVSDKDAPF